MGRWQIKGYAWGHEKMLHIIDNFTLFFLKIVGFLIAFVLAFAIGGWLFFN